MLLLAVEKPSTATAPVTAEIAHLFALIVVLALVGNLVHLVERSMFCNIRHLLATEIHFKRAWRVATVALLCRDDRGKVGQVS